MNSCTEDDDTPDPKPTITVTVDSVSTGWQGDVIDFTIIIGSNSNLETLKIQPDNANGPTTNFFDTSYTSNTNNETINYSYTIPTSGINDGDVIEITFTVTDEVSSQNVSKNVNIVIPGGNAINTFNNIILGSYNHTTGSFCASFDGGVYTISTAKANQSLIDFLYYYGATNKATIAAPNDVDAGTITTLGLSTWTTKNATTFKKVTNTIDWANVVDDVVIEEETASGVTETAITDLSDNDVLAFISTTGKKGLIKINTIVIGDNGTVDLSIKVQQ